jgi:hypothetical protein
MNATSIMMSSVLRLRPKYRLCGGSKRSRRFENAHVVAPVPAPRKLRLFLLCPSSGAFQVDSVLLSVFNSFKCAVDGSATSFRGIVNALMFVCTEARSFAQRCVYICMGYLKNELKHYRLRKEKSVGLSIHLLGIECPGQIVGYGECGEGKDDGCAGACGEARKGSTRRNGDGSEIRFDTTEDDPSRLHARSGSAVDQRLSSHRSCLPLLSPPNLFTTTRPV